jgi:hypothetical protein
MVVAKVVLRHGCCILTERMLLNRKSEGIQRMAVFLTVEKSLRLAAGRFDKRIANVF